MGAASGRRVPPLEIPVFGRWYRRALVSVSAVCAAALVVSGLPSDQAWGEDPPVEPSPEVSAPASPETVDLPSAVVPARATGGREEVTAERPESSTTWVNPDGTVTTTQHAVPVRFQDGEGAWCVAGDRSGGPRDAGLHHPLTARHRRIPTPSTPSNAMSPKSRAHTLCSGEG